MAITNHGSCDPGYNPMNFEISDLAMFYNKNYSDESSEIERVLADLNIHIQLMIKDQTYKKFSNLMETPLIKFRIKAEEVNLIFTP